MNKLTVGKIYAGILIVENWRAYKATRTQKGNNNQVSNPQFDVGQCRYIHFRQGRNLFPLLTPRLA